MQSQASVRNWLVVVAAMIFFMIVLGALTRLTESGLSMVEWRPITGILPPLTAEAWQAELQKYLSSPQGRLVNRSFTVPEFQQIYWLEFLHRLWGRLIGMAFALPLLWFAVRRQIPAGYGWRLGALLALGGFQGAIGWWMVASGLVERTDVSHIRLTVHLLTALFILAGIVWTALDLMALHRNRLAAPARLTLLGAGAVLTLFVQLMFGALTAGLDAGYAFSSWPLMGDAVFPAGVPMVDPAWRNAVDNPVVVQFFHRWWAFATAAALVWLAIRATRSGSKAGLWVVLLVTLQIVLGIATLMSGVQIDIAVAHQGNAALLLIATVFAAHAIGGRDRRFA